MKIKGQKGIAQANVRTDSPWRRLFCHQYNLQVTSLRNGDEIRTPWRDNFRAKQMGERVLQVSTSVNIYLASFSFSFPYLSLHTSPVEPSSKLKMLYVYCVSLQRNWVVRPMVMADRQPNFVRGSLFTVRMSFGNWIHGEKLSISAAALKLSCHRK